MYNFVILLHTIVALHYMYSFSQAFSTKWTVSYISAGAFLSGLCFHAVLSEFVIVRFDYRSQILHAAVANFGVIAIKYLMQYGGVQIFRDLNH